MTRRARRPRPVADDRGSVTIELLVLIVVFVFILLLITAVARVTRADIQVTGAAAAGARAASLARSPAAGKAQAHAVVESSLAGNSWSCAGGPVVEVAGTWRPGGAVQVTVTCRVPLADLGLPLPAEASYRADASSVVETYRSSR